MGVLLRMSAKCLVCGGKSSQLSTVNLHLVAVVGYGKYDKQWLFKVNRSHVILGSNAAFFIVTISVLIALDCASPLSEGSSIRTQSPSSM